MIRLKRKSMFTSKMGEMEINITKKEYEEGLRKMCNGMHIQNAFPQLSAGEREFMISRITPQEWEEVFSKKEEEEED